MKIHAIFLEVRWARLAPIRKKGRANAFGRLVQATLRDLFERWTLLGIARGKWIAPRAYLAGTPKQFLIVKKQEEGSWKPLFYYGLGSCDRVRIEFGEKELRCA